ncbi:conserved hypothetical protein [Thiomonas sp. X19]|uniref:hypothetical protein n=1 Tax=Thiomonas sp. X19 TaxID=1050370 RepID=UPI000B67444A|nr:hypothetical protein [Thiomonas sp. X19]SCC93098.1 conserved hypothetical protein [Thiomonas sp. X19]
MHTILIDTAPVAGAPWQQALAATSMPRLSRCLRLAEVSLQEALHEDAEAAWLSPAERWLLAALGQPGAVLDPAPDAATAPNAAPNVEHAPAQAAAPSHAAAVLSEQAPWGALAALAAGQALRGLPWGLALPAHLELGRESLSLANPAALQLTVDEAQALLDAVRPLLSDAGWHVDAGNPGRWLVAHSSLAEVVTADPARAIARNVAAWMPAGTPARPWRQLLTEMQMVWQYHPVNEARMRAGRPEANTLWLHGCGALPAGLRNPFVMQRQAAQSATAWWPAAHAGLPKLPASRHPHPLQVLQPQATRETDAEALGAAVAALDQAAAGAIDQALRDHAGAQVVLAGDRRWIGFELHKARRWQFWRRADAHVLLGLV